MKNKKYLELMQMVIWDIRIEAREKGNLDNIYDMADIIENIPGLLMDKGRPIDDSRLLAMLIEYEKKYFDGKSKYSSILLKSELK